MGLAVLRGCPYHYAIMHRTDPQKAVKRASLQAMIQWINIAGVVGPFGSGSPANHSTGFDLPCGM